MSKKKTPKPPVGEPIDPTGYPGPRPDPPQPCVPAPKVTKGTNQK